MDEDSALSISREMTAIAVEDAGLANEPVNRVVWYVAQFIRCLPAPEHQHVANSEDGASAVAYFLRADRLFAVEMTVLSREGDETHPRVHLEIAHLPFEHRGWRVALAADHERVENGWGFETKWSFNPDDQEPIAIPGKLMLDPQVWPDEAEKFARVLAQKAGCPLEF